jgi:hypothetical protein
MRFRLRRNEGQSALLEQLKIIGTVWRFMQEVCCVGSGVQQFKCSGRLRATGLSLKLSAAADGMTLE